MPANKPQARTLANQRLIIEVECEDMNRFDAQSLATWMRELGIKGVRVTYTDRPVGS